MQNVSRNGTMLLNITQHGRGDLDPQVVRICKDVGAWLKVNGEAVYAPARLKSAAKTPIRFATHATTAMSTPRSWTGTAARSHSRPCAPAERLLGKVSKVELLGSDMPLTFVQDEQGLTVTPGGAAQPLAGIANEQLASRCRVCASPTTRAGSTTTTRAWWLSDGSAAATWAPATSTTT